jgi:hypothetical protein
MGRARRWLPGIARSRAQLLALAWLWLGCGRIGVELVPVEHGSRPDAGRLDAGSNPAADGGSDAGALCQLSCDNSHGSALCQAGVCTVECANGYADCDGRSDNGCEANITSAADSCGGCGASCQNLHGGRSCSSGLCAPTCSQGFADCDGEPDNGCESDLSRPISCGDCATSCSNEHGTTVCNNGKCLPSCAGNFADCDGEAKNGCETNLMADPTHCGSCEKACGTTGQICDSGSCAASPCPIGRGECDHDSSVICESDLQTSSDNCGFCGNVCQLDHAAVSCRSGSCAIASCAAGYADCDASPSDGCEVALASTAAHCGSCAVACQNAHGSTGCAANSCTPVCASGFGNCDTDLVNGCETDLGTISNCGMCGHSCPAVSGGTALCNAGVCGSRCNLNGTFAIKLSIQINWNGTNVVQGGSASWIEWARLQATQSGNALTGTLSDCGRSTPDFSSLADTYALDYPDTLFDHAPAYLPSVSASVALGSNAPGATFALARVAFLSGVSLNDPLQDAWPNSVAGVSQVDMDNDGKPGVTASYINDSRHAYPPTSTNVGATHADAPYEAERLVFGLNGTLTSCTQASGSANVTRVDTHVIGCHLTNGGSCDPGDTNFFDTNRPVYNPASATYSLVKIADNATCATVRSTLP